MTPATRAVAGSTVVPGTSPLGVRYTCFVCSAKFYDLNRPEPVCPRCETNQNDRPKEPPKPRVRKKGGRRKARGMGPLFDDDDEEVVVVKDEGMTEVGLEATLLEKRGGDGEDETEES